MRIITAPHAFEPDGTPAIFLAGGITDCPNWQAEAIALLSFPRLTLFNPRRENFPIENPFAAQQQIEWEHTMIRKANAIFFWFPQETLCPIALYELGAWSMTSKPLFVGTHPLYKRRQDVVIQTSLARPDVCVFPLLSDVVLDASRWLRIYETQRNQSQTSSFQAAAPPCA